MPNIFDVAKYILHKVGPMSTMKLQKLCYYSQAWSLVWDDTELFSEDFQAWANGPVCKELFNSHKGQFKISEDDIHKQYLSTERLDENQMETIDVVLGTYANKNGQWLSTLTHMEDPWKIARANTPSGMPSETIITKESMAMYYGSL